MCRRYKASGRRAKSDIGDSDQFVCRRTCQPQTSQALHWQATVGFALAFNTLGRVMVPIKLTEFDKAEWFDVMKLLRPDLSAAEYDNAWAEFQRDKAEHQRKMKLQ